MRDWKFLTSTFIAIAGIAIPLSIWFFDQAPKSIQVRIVSITSLEPDKKDLIGDIKIYAGDEEIKSPNSIALEISNKGLKPIPSNDYEEPITIFMAGNASIVRAKVTSSEPIDLRPILDVTEREIKVRPALLNSGDKFSIALLTAGDHPTLKARARISGIPNIEIRDDATNNKSSGTVLANTVAALLITIYAYLLMLAIRWKTQLRIRIALASMATVNCFGGILISMANSGDSSKQPFDNGLYGLIFIFIGIVAAVFSFRKNRLASPT